jgi:hypothetical protein
MFKYCRIHGELKKEETYTVRNKSTRTGFAYICKICTAFNNTKAYDKPAYAEKPIEELHSDRKERNRLFYDFLCNKYNTIFNRYDDLIDSAISYMYAVSSFK